MRKTAAVVGGSPSSVSQSFLVSARSRYRSRLPSTAIFPTRWAGLASTFGKPRRSLSARSLAGAVFGLLALVIGTVALLIASPQLALVEGLDISGLPRFHAMLNTTTTALLATGYVLIRKGRVRSHRTVMLSAFLLSIVFLLSCVVYHAQAPVTRYGGEGLIRGIYFFVLVTYVVLAPVILPLALYTVARALRGELLQHRRIARWTLPIWIYVTITGVAVYLMMAPYYDFP